MRRLLRPWLLVPVCVVAGAAAGLALTPGGGERHRAEVKVAVGQGQSLFPSRPQPEATEPLTRTLANLVESSVVADNVIGNLRLADLDADELLDRLTVDVQDGANVLVLSVTDDDQQRAVRIAQEIALVFTQLVRERFSVTTAQPEQLPLTAVVFDPARAVEDTSGDRVVYAAAGGAAGLVLGLLAALATAAARRRAPATGEPERKPAEETPAAPEHARELESLREELRAARREADDRARELKAARRVLAALRGVSLSPVEAGEAEAVRAARDDSARDELAARRAEIAEREAALEERNVVITRREREAARLHGQLAARERELDAREAGARSVPAPQPAPQAPPPPREPAPEPERAHVPPDGGVGIVTLDELERLVSTHAGEFPDRAEEWSYYLVYLRGYADTQGRLPSSFDWLIEDTFGELLARRASV